MATATGPSLLCAHPAGAARRDPGSSSQEGPVVRRSQRPPPLSGMAVALHSCAGSAMPAEPDEWRRRRLLMETGANFPARGERHEGHPSRFPESDRRGRAARGSAGGLGGRRLRVRCARDAEGAHRHHRAHRLLVHRHGARARAVQEARHRVHDLQGGVVGGDPRSPHPRREPGHPHAPRHALRVHHGPAGLAREADDHPLLPEPQRAGDHAHQGPA